MKTRLSLLLFLILLLASCISQQDRAPLPLYSFGVLADVQYADQPNAGARHYRSSLKSLATCVASLNQQDLDFVVQLGDFIDRGKTSFDSVLPLWQQLRARKFHVIGNHDLPFLRSQTMQKLGLEQSYYDFAVGERWRFVVVDGMDISLHGYPKDHEKRLQATAMLKVLKERKARNAVMWNGGVGKQQLTWMESVLQDATEKQQRVVLFCHFPVHSEAGDASLLLWNHEEITAMLHRYPCVAGWFNGHHHSGGYAMVDGVHHVTFLGMVEAPERNAYATVDVYESQLVINGVGKQPSHTLKLVPR